MKSTATALLVAMTLLLNLLTGCAAPGAPPPAPSGTRPGTTPQALVPGPSEVRAPAVAGRFYPGDAAALAAMVDAMLAEAEKAPDFVRLPAPPIAIVVPHAGYVFSGQVASYAFQQLRGAQYETVVVVGTNHTDPGFHKVSVYARGTFQTPLGPVQVDENLAARIVATDPQRLVFDPGIHRQEHSIEVQLPFLQRLLPGAKLVPIIVAEPFLDNAQVLSSALVKALADTRALIVATSDLSHYPSYDDARRVDLAALAAVLTRDTQVLQRTLREQERLGLRNLETCACGEGPLLTVMLAAKGLGADQAALLRYANSGDTPFGDREQVVGYGAVAFWRGAPVAERSMAPPSAVAAQLVLGAAEKTRLLGIAREAIGRYIQAGFAPAVEVTEPALQRKAAVFVTLKKGSELRGCIGQVIAQWPLYLAVQRAAMQAATEDPRFSPLQATELSEVRLEISVLSPLEPVRDVQEIEVGRHGLAIVQGQRSGLLLPQVATEEGWDREAFLQGLCRKAGLPADAWKQGATLYRFTADVFGEP